jgi:hypothetical protein
MYRYGCAEADIGLFGAFNRIKRQRLLGEKTYPLSAHVDRLRVHFYPMLRAEN